MNFENDILKYLEENESKFRFIAKKIWDNPELPLEEHYSSEIIKEELKKENFRINDNIKNIPTAFVATWGKEGPIIGILGEYDALPDLSQKICAEKEPVKEGTPGHGCGHNLLGVGSLGAAIAIKKILKKNNIKGIIKYFGCPAEEILIGKVFMAKEGVFHDLDLVITWHPKYLNEVWRHSTNAMNSFKINFYGISTHEASAPDKGRSALDAVLLLENGVNLMQRHIMHEVFTHRVITNGGTIPDCTAPYSQIWYFIRAPIRNEVTNVYRKILEIAKGASLMTGTKYDVELITGTYDYKANKVLGDVVLNKLKKLGPPKFNEDDVHFAKKLQCSISKQEKESMISSFGNELTMKEIGDPLCKEIVDRKHAKMVLGSTEVGDVSYIAPTIQFTTCCMPLGVGLHTWQSTASFGSDIGMKGMILASKVMALTVLECIKNPNIIESAYKEYQTMTKGENYISPLSDIIQKD